MIGALQVGIVNFITPGQSLSHLRWYVTSQAYLSNNRWNNPFCFCIKWVYEVRGIQGLDSQYEVEMNSYIHYMKNFKWIVGIHVYHRTLWFETFFIDKSNGVVILIKHGTSTPLWVNGKPQIAWCQEKGAVVFLKSLIFSLKVNTGYTVIMKNISIT